MTETLKSYGPAGTATDLEKLLWWRKASAERKMRVLGPLICDCRDDAQLALDAFAGIDSGVLIGGVARAAVAANLQSIIDNAGHYADLLDSCSNKKTRP